MKLPRDLSGVELAAKLRRYGYEETRQSGSHLRLTSTARGGTHHITIPVHSSLRIGTLARIISDVSDYLDVDRDRLVEELFGR